MAQSNDYEEKSLYEQETESNYKVFRELVRKIRPDIYVLMDLLDQTGVNPVVIFKVIRQINNIAIGNKYGQVHVIMENGIVTFVKGEEADKVGEPAIVENKPKFR